jgi:hypothetical protein
VRFRTHHGAADGRHGPSRARRRAFAAMVAVVVSFGVVTARRFVSPAQGMSARVSAIVMLAVREIACPWRCSLLGSTGRQCSLSRQAGRATEACAPRR